MCANCQYITRKGSLKSCKFTNLIQCKDHHRLKSFFGINKRLIIAQLTFIIFLPIAFSKIFYYRRAVIPLIVKSLRSPRSAVCKTAIMASADIFKAYNDMIIDSFDPLVCSISSLLHYFIFC